MTFDRLQHNNLLTKLMAWGVQGVAHSLMSSYLLDRRQYIDIGNSISWDRAIRSGVPQGSVLGFLFNILINDMTDMQNEARTFYTWMIPASVSGPEASEVIRKVNTSFPHYQNGPAATALNLARKESKAVLFSTRGRQVPLCVELLLDNQLKLIANIGYLVTFLIVCRVGHPLLTYSELPLRRTLLRQTIA